MHAAATRISSAAKASGAEVRSQQRVMVVSAAKMREQNTSSRTAGRIFMYEDALSWLGDQHHGLDIEA